MNDTTDPDDSAERTKEERATTSTANKKSGGFDLISPRARRFMSKGARDNPKCETTIAVFESVEETMVFRIFRQRHSGDKNPLDAADQWTRWVKKHCTSIRGELAATAVWTDADVGSVLVTITGQGIIAKEETGQVI